LIHAFDDSYRELFISSIISLNVKGVCEPVGSPLCAEKNSWLMDCMPGKFNCPAINAPGKTIADFDIELTYPEAN